MNKETRQKCGPRVPQEIYVPAIHCKSKGRESQQNTMNPINNLLYCISEGEKSCRKFFKKHLGVRERCIRGEGGRVEMPSRFITVGVTKEMRKQRSEGNRSVSSVDTWGRAVPDCGSPQDPKDIQLFTIKYDVGWAFLLMCFMMLRKSRLLLVC